ncbi:hypothetical protein [Burkholderia phage FLC8]|nr:hypothetical protein [Burkholderia phage FLC8]
MDDHDRMKQLVSLILEYDRKYHDDDQPGITDHEYDALVRELQELEKKHPDHVDPESPTLRVGFKPNVKFEKVDHKAPMLSLNNVFSEQEFREWDSKLHLTLKANPTSRGKNFDRMVPFYVCELKFDGLSLDLQYKRQGNKLMLDKAVTRGDGTTGEDVTHNIRHVKNIPLIIPDANGLDELEVRGEVIMPNAAFLKTNAELHAKGEKEYGNPRNAAAGALRTLDSSKAKGRGLEFMCYGYGHFEENIINWMPDTHYGILELFSEWGFNTNSDYCWVANDVNEVIKIHNDVKAMREKLEFGIDGFVVKLNYRAAQAIVGFVSRAPRFSIAWKFPAEEAVTTLEAIDVQVGRTGAITPVGRLKPVFVGGVWVSNATLHNEDEIHRKGLRIGDKVIVRRAGDVVPEIVGPLEKERTGNETFFHMPVHCPDCGSTIQKEDEEGKIYRCTGGLKCPAQKFGMFCHAVSRKALNIVGMGEKTIEELIEHRFIYELADLFELTADHLHELEGMGEKSIRNLLDAIEAARDTTPQRFVYALGIRHVGEETAKDLCRHTFNMDLIRELTVDELMRIEGIGEETAKSIYTYFRENWDSIEKLLKHLRFPKKDDALTVPQTLKGRNFSITGSFEGMSRDDIKAFIEARGGNLLPSISKKAEFLLLGKEPSAGKVEKAMKLGLKFIDFVPEIIENF